MIRSKKKTKNFRKEEEQKFKMVGVQLETHAPVLLLLALTLLLPLLKRRRTPGIILIIGVQRSFPLPLFFRAPPRYGIFIT